MAVLVLMIILLPIAGLMVTTNKTILNSQFRQEAQSLAESALNQQRSYALTAAGSISAPPWSSFSPALPSGSGWSSTATVQTVDSESYSTYLAGGWCAANVTGSSSSYGSSAGAPLTYVVAVKVTWGTTGSASAGKVVIDGPLATEPGWFTSAVQTVPSSATNCPTGLS